MGDRTLYDEDILVWSEQQAAALRSLASRHDLPNELDLANVIEEIEDVGRSELHTVESRCENDPRPIWRGLGRSSTHRRSRHWAAEVRQWNGTNSAADQPVMRARLDMDVALAARAAVAAASWTWRNEDKAAARDRIRRN